MDNCSGHNETHEAVSSVDTLNATNRKLSANYAHLNKAEMRTRMETVFGVKKRCALSTENDYRKAPRIGETNQFGQ